MPCRAALCDAVRRGEGRRGGLRLLRRRREVLLNVASRARHRYVLAMRMTFRTYPSGPTSYETTGRGRCHVVGTNNTTNNTNNTNNTNSNTRLP